MPSPSFDQHMLPLVLFARLVEIGVEELARNVDHPTHRTADRRAVDVDIEHAHENRNPGHRCGIELRPAAAVIDRKLAGRRHLDDRGYQPVRRRDDEAIVLRRDPHRIAEEREYRRDQRGQRPCDRLPGKESGKRRGPRCDQAEFAALWMNRRPMPPGLAPSLIVENFTWHRRHLGASGRRGKAGYRAFACRAMPRGQRRTGNRPEFKGFWSFRRRGRLLHPEAPQRPARHSGIGGQGWIRTTVRLRGQIYSLLPLTTRPPVHTQPVLGRRARKARPMAKRALPVNGAAGREHG